MSATVGDALLAKGSFLLNSGNDNDILYLNPTGAGQGVTSGIPVVLLTGNDIGLGGASNDIDGPTRARLAGMPAGESVLQVTLHPANASNKVVSASTDLLAGRPWHVAGAITRT